MSCDANVQKARELVLLARDDLDTKWQIVGGLVDFSWDGSTPTETVTSTSTQGSFTENEATGYKEMSLSASGVADVRTGTDETTGLEFVGASRLSDIWFSANSCGKFMVLNTATNGFIEGFFIVTAYGQSGARPGLLNFTSSFQSKSDVTKVGDI